ncbi:hypothetical protein CXG81DRAFT_27041 [Caulochytrium protostelioides]|uniref:Galactose oxidase n=1 Tax=Caulochytrium protostelioides TaxID=1555241 RepID=A0A4P9X568_9FUNG|nr:hypothetical protein CXG81DRAFT_27041 [Caulochytrium protostelioides]|eukprot:RKP00253.1 hypothetical protein CXG81DRAFT_27041 [Caulochytrium protostelioides]
MWRPPTARLRLTPLAAHHVDTAPAPVPRVGCALVPAADGSRLVLVAGANHEQGVQNDVWQLDLASETWSRPAAAAAAAAACPSPRYELVLVPATRQAEAGYVLFGGSAGDALCSDTWWLRPDLTWTPLSTTGTTPSPRTGHGCVTTGREGDCLTTVFGGGMGSSPVADDRVYQLDLTTLVWTATMPTGPLRPAPRLGHTLTALDADNLVLLGGLVDPVAAVAAPSPPSKQAALSKPSPPSATAAAASAAATALSHGPLWHYAPTEKRWTPIRCDDGRDRASLARTAHTTSLVHADDGGWILLVAGGMQCPPLTAAAAAAATAASAPALAAPTLLVMAIQHDPDGGWVARRVSVTGDAVARWPARLDHAATTLPSPPPPPPPSATRSASTSSASAPPLPSSSPPASRRTALVLAGGMDFSRVMLDSWRIELEFVPASAAPSAPAAADGVVDPSSVFVQGRALPADVIVDEETDVLPAGAQALPKGMVAFSEV